MQFWKELTIALVTVGVSLVFLLAFSYWYLEQIDKMEQAAEDYLFSEIQASTARFRERAHRGK